MKVPVAIKADILKAIMSEDRKEIQSLRASVYNIISGITLASFAVTAFLLKTSPPSPMLLITTDLLMIAFIWVIFARLRYDLYEARKGLVARQDLIKGLDESNPTDLNPFPDASKVVPDIRDADLAWIPVAATLAIM